MQSASDPLLPPTGATTDWLAHLKRVDALLKQAVTRYVDWLVHVHNHHQDLGDDAYREVLALLERRNPTTAPATAPATPPVALPTVTSAPFDHLRKVFGLTDQDSDLLLLALAPQVSMDYGTIYGYLNGGSQQTYLMVHTATRILSVNQPNQVATQARLLSPAPLVRYQLVQLSAQTPADDLPEYVIKPSPSLVRWLLHGQLFGAHDQSSACTRLATSRDPLIPGSVRERIRNLHPVLTEGVTCAIVGSSPGLREGCATSLARAVGRDLVRVDLDQLHHTLKDGPFGVIRDLTLQNAMPYLVNPPAADAEPAKRERIQTLVNTLATVPIPMCVGGRDRKSIAKLLGSTRPSVTLTVTKPTRAERVSAWQQALAERGWDQAPAASIAGRFHFLGGTRVSQVLDLARTEAGGQAPTTKQLWAACRETAKPAHCDLAEVVDPQYTWEDLVLPIELVAQLRLLERHVSQQETVFQEWGASRTRPRGQGMKALFVGGPGTGKTMCAEVLANSLKLALLKVDLSQIVSKWVGETQKNLRQVFDVAEGGGAIVLFDEGDALFGSRGETKSAQDKYANQEVSYLLQRLETFDGSVIITTNLLDNVDAAFLRRFGAVIHFPRPGRKEMEQLWERAIPKHAPRASDLNLPWVAQNFRLSGGLIVNAAINACVHAATEGQPLGQRHLMIAIARELDKEGKQLRLLNFGNHTDLVLRLFRQ